MCEIDIGFFIAQVWAFGYWIMAEAGTIRKCQAMIYWAENFEKNNAGGWRAIFH